MNISSRKSEFSPIKNEKKRKEKFKQDAILKKRLQDKNKRRVLNIHRMQSFFHFFFLLTPL